MKCAELYIVVDLYDTMLSVSVPFACDYGSNGSKRKMSHLLDPEHP